MNESNSYRLIIILTLFLIIQGCSLETPTPISFSTPMPKELHDQIRDAYVASIDPLLKEWDEVNQLATDRGRYDWLNLIIKMQEIRNGFAQLEVDPTVEDIHSQMILHMDCQIAAYVAFVSPRDYSTIELLEEPDVIFGRCSFPVAE
jgi:hypothetical protein